jgi:hypothetical protein
MTDLEILVKEFFNEYERANAEFDVQRIAEWYADAFCSVGPQAYSRKEGRIREGAPSAQGVLQIVWTGHIHNREPRSLEP